MKILLVVYDNDSRFHVFPSGVAYIAAALEREGHEVIIYSQDKFHYPDEHLTMYIDNNSFDVVGLSIIAGYYQYKKLKKISRAINSTKRRPLYILGGHGPAPEPEFFLKVTKADVVVIGEGEITIIELLKAISNHKPLSSVKGIAYNDGGRVVVNSRRTLIKDVDSIPFPAYHLFPVNYYKLRGGTRTSSTDFVMDFISGRGCKFRCSFCFRLDKSFRPRSAENVIEEIKILKQDYGITHIVFQDELLMSSIERTIGLCEKFIKAKINITWNCNGRLNYAKPDVLKLMKRAGCVFINYGIEAMDDQVLKNMHKGLNTKLIIKGIKATLDVGISPGFNIIFGNIGDSKETIDRGVKFLLKYDDGAQLRTIRPVTPYPGSPLYYYAIEKGLLKDCEDFYENKHTNSDLLSVNFTDLTDDEFYKVMLDANTRLIKNYFEKQLKNMLEQTQKLYLKRDASFRGYRHSY